MKKRDILSLLYNPTRLAILRRLSEAGKAAYSDIMDSVDYIQPLNSTGNLNYHLKFLLKSRVIEKNGAVYRLTDTGNAILHFIDETESRWHDLQRSLSGDTMNIIQCAEQFEEETGVKMEKEPIDFHGSKMIMDENRIIGLLNIEHPIQMFEKYELLDSEGFTLSRREYIDENDVSREVTLLCHDDLRYELSPKWFGMVQDFLERNYGRAMIYARLDVPSPFLISSDAIGTAKTAVSFVVAPAVVDSNLRGMAPKKMT